ncbi:MAG: peptidoglycan DD-metalloendopeptidase family protein [Patescibacteria group bacterium]
MKLRNLFFHILIACAATIPFSGPVRAADAEIRPIVFPTERNVTLTDDFGDARSAHVHEGNDLMGKKMMPLYSAINGRVLDVVDPEASWGYAITLIDEDGYTYHYLHVNNDTPGTDDGNGGTQYAYASGIERWATVTKGQLIGWMGDSGNAENVGAHLHFEIRLPDGTAIDPYPSLMAAYNHVATYDFSPAVASSTSPDINTDKGLAATNTDTPPCVSGDLVKSTSTSAVYYCGANGKRYVFPNDRIYFTWYKDFKSVTTITAEQLAAIPLGGNVTYRPGVKIVKIESVPNVYAVDKGGVLRWITTPAAAAALYGKDWAKQVDDLSIAFFGNYKMGASVVQTE